MGCVWGVCGVCGGCGVCMGCVWGVYGVCMGCVRGVRGVCMGCVWGLYGVCMGCVWGASGDGSSEENGEACTCFLLIIRGFEDEIGEKYKKRLKLLEEEAAEEIIEEIEE